VKENKEEDASSCWIISRKRKDSRNWKRSTRSPSVENSLWKRLWTCRKTE